MSWFQSKIRNVLFISSWLSSISNNSCEVFRVLSVCRYPSFSYLSMFLGSFVHRCCLEPPHMRYSSWPTLNLNKCVGLFHRTGVALKYSVLGSPYEFWHTLQVSVSRFLTHLMSEVQLLAVVLCHFRRYFLRWQQIVKAFKKPSGILLPRWSLIPVVPFHITFIFFICVSKLVVVMSCFIPTKA